MNIPTLLTLFRIAISPLFLLLYLEHDWVGISSETMPYFLLALLGISELTDTFDGYLARKYEQVTDLGKILDPMADSITHIAILLAFTSDPIRIPLFLVFIFLYRDSIVSAIRTICALKGIALAASKNGKIKTGLLAGSLIITTILMIPHAMGFITTDTLRLSSLLMISIAALYSLFSCFEYLYSNRLVWLKG